MSRFEVHHGDCLDVMRSMPDASVDAVVCDPPYALTANKKGGTGAASINLESPYGRARIGTGNGGGGFMGKAWDSSLPPVEVWTAALRVAKPGAHLLAFGGTRTFHRLTCAIEDAGWEIRDCLSWLYGSGFPKSHNGAWGGTALKPAWEPIILARKPLAGTVAANHAAHGTGALNIDGCRIEAAPGDYAHPGNDGIEDTTKVYGDFAHKNQSKPNGLGRWPANVALDEDAAAALDEQSTCHSAGHATDGKHCPSLGAFGPVPVIPAGMPSYRIGDDGGASRFFYTAKASRAEREAGLDGFDPVRRTDGRNVEAGQTRNDDPRIRTAARVNHHPTVKPVDLMRWLVRLVTPLGGLVLDPFLGSGTTGVAALEEGCRFVGIEREAEYVAIARARIQAADRSPLLPFGDAP